jgi:lipoprotein Spr
MGKNFFYIIIFAFFTGSCSNLKQLGFTTSATANVTAQPQNQSSTSGASQEKPSDVKFLNNITVSPQNPATHTADLQLVEKKEPEPVVVSSKEPDYISATNNFSTDNELALQMKYAALLNTDVSQVQNRKLFEFIDDWYGTRYCMGGTSKNCIDCSAFVQSLFSAIYGLSVPRTAKTQYTASRRISTTQLKEGDLLFFHTRSNRRGVTHVGVYLQNNKFVHASSSGGVKISDMYEPYYVQHLIGAGRVLN